MKKSTLALVGYLSLITLCVTSLSLSIAWYASASQLRVESIPVKLRTDRNLTISTSEDEDSFKSELSYEELSDSGLFSPVSGERKSSWYDSQESKPVLYSAYKPYASTDGVPADPTAATSGFFQEELYLKCDDDVYVTLDLDNTSFTSDTERNEAYASTLTSDETEKEELVAGMNKLVNALRFSILVPDEDTYAYYLFDPNKETTTYFGGTLDLGKTGFYNYYEDESGEQYETLFGEISNRDKAVYSTSTSAIGYEGELTSFNSGTKEGVHHFLKDESLANGLTIASEDSLTLEESQTEMFIPLERYVPKKIVISIYLEGWDLDCINSTMGASFLSNICFRIARERV